MTHEEIVEKAFFLTGAGDDDIRDEFRGGSSFLYFQYYKDMSKVIDEWLAGEGDEHFSAIWTGGNKIELVHV